MITVQGVLQSEKLKSPANLRSHRNENFKRLLHHSGPDKRKGAFEHAQNVRVTSLFTNVKSHPGIFSPLMHSVVYNDSGSGQQKSWSECADAQANLVHRCPPISEDTFSHAEADITIFCCRSHHFTLCILMPASVAQLDARRTGGRGFDPRRGRQHSFAEIDHEIFSTVILSLLLIQEGQLSVSGERMCTILVNHWVDWLTGP